MFTSSIEDSTLFELKVLENGFIAPVKIFLTVTTNNQTKEEEFTCVFLCRTEEKKGYFSYFGYLMDFDIPCSGTFYFVFYVDGIPYKTEPKSFVITQQNASYNKV